MRRLPLLALCLLMISNQSYACGLKDYQCKKKEKYAKYYTKHNKTYLKNEKIYVTGKDHGSAISLDSRNGRYKAKNVRIISRNYKTYGDHGRAAVLDVNNYSSDPNAINLEDVYVRTIGVNRLTGHTDYTSDSECVASYCQYGNIDIDNLTNVNQGNLYLNYR